MPPLVYSGRYNIVGQFSPSPGPVGPTIGTSPLPPIVPTPSIPIGPINVPSPTINTPFGTASACPPGWGCSGPSINLPGGVTGCLGSCYPGGGGGGITQGDIDPCPAGFVYNTDLGTCIAADYPSPTTALPTGGNGGRSCGCQGGQVRCQTAKGGCGHLNKSGYYVYGRGGNPANAQYVPPGSKCVKTRPINPANGKAAMRAIRRVRATHNLMKRIDKQLQKVARRR